MELAALEASRVVMSLVSRELALSRLRALLVIADVLDLAELVELGTLAMLLVIDPVTIVQCARIFGDIHASSVRLAIDPRAVVDIAGSVSQTALSVVKLVAHLTSVDGAVLVLDDADAFTVRAVFLAPETTIDDLLLVLAILPNFRQALRVVPPQIFFVIVQPSSELTLRHEWLPGILRKHAIREDGLRQADGFLHAIQLHPLGLSAGNSALRPPLERLGLSTRYDVPLALEIVGH